MEVLMQATVCRLVFALALPWFALPAKLTLEDLTAVASIGAPVLSHDGKWFALTSQGQIVLAPSNGGWPTPLTAGGGGKSAIDWSPDGSYLTFVSGGAIWTVPTAGGQPLRLTEGTHGAGDPRTAADRTPLWSPKGDWILFETGRHGNSDLAVVRPDGTVTSLLTSGPADEGNAAWSPDGAKVAWVERSKEFFSGRVRIAAFDRVSGRLKDVPNTAY